MLKKNSEKIDTKKYVFKNKKKEKKIFNKSNASIFVKKAFNNQIRGAYLFYCFLLKYLE